MIINPQFIGSRQTHRKRGLHRIDLHEDHGEHCIEEVYGELLTHHWRGHGVDEEALCI